MKLFARDALLPAGWARDIVIDISGDGEIRAVDVAFAAPADAERVPAAAAATGIRLTLLPVFYAHSDFGGAPPLPAQRRFIHDIDSFRALLSVLARPRGEKLGIAPHSLRAVTPAELAELVDFARANRDDMPIHIHAAEQRREVDDCMAWSGTRPVQWLLDNAAVD